MGLFDYFTKSYEDKPKKNKEKSTIPETFSSESRSSNMLDSFKPESFDDLYGYLDILKVGKPIIVDCSALKETTAIRVLDILSGATYALNGEWKSIASEVFMFVPNGSPENGRF